MRDLWLPFRWLSLAPIALCHRPILAGTTSRFSGFLAGCRQLFPVTDFRRLQDHIRLAGHPPGTQI
jgi:hypothetical protein